MMTRISFNNNSYINYSQSKNKNSAVTFKSNATAVVAQAPARITSLFAGKLKKISELGMRKSKVIAIPAEKIDFLIGKMHKITTQLNEGMPSYQRQECWSFTKTGRDGKVTDRFSYIGAHIPLPESKKMISDNADAFVKSKADIFVRINAHSPKRQIIVRLDQQTGQIESCNKPFWMPMKLVEYKVAKLLDFFAENQHNRNKVGRDITQL